MPLQRNLAQGVPKEPIRPLNDGTLMRAEARAPLRLIVPAFASYIGDPFTLLRLAFSTVALPRERSAAFMPLQRNHSQGGRKEDVSPVGHGTLMRAEARAPGE